MKVIRNFDIESTGLENLKNTSAIYSIHRSPRSDNVNEYVRFLKFLSERKTYTAQEFHKTHKIQIELIPQQDQIIKNIEDKTYEEYLHIITELSPPLYVGMSEEVGVRIAKHHKELNYNLNELDEIGDYHEIVFENSLEYKLNSSTIVEHSNFANRISQLIKTCFIKSDKRPGISNFYFKIYPLDEDKLSRGQIISIENSLINSLIPFSNSKF